MYSGKMSFLSNGRLLLDNNYKCVPKISAIVRLLEIRIFETYRQSKKCYLTFFHVYRLK